jgi:hypothetical protein
MPRRSPPKAFRNYALALRAQTIEAGQRARRELMLLIKPVDADAYARRGRRENLETRRGSTAAGHCRGTARLPVCTL